MNSNKKALTFIALQGCFWEQGMSLETLFLIHFIELWPLNSTALMTCSWGSELESVLPGK